MSRAEVEWLHEPKRLAGEMGLVKLGTIAVDGTKIKANAKANNQAEPKQVLADAGYRSEEEMAKQRPET